MSERFIMDTCGTLIDMETRTTYDYVSEVCPLLNEQDADLMMQREKALYWRNKAEDIFGDMQTNVELKKENIKLKERIKKLKLELNTHKHPLWSTRQCQERIRELEQANDEEYLTIQTSAQTLLTHLNHEYHNKKQYNEKFNYEEFQRIREFLTALTILNLTELDEIRTEMEE